METKARESEVIGRKIQNRVITALFVIVATFFFSASAKGAGPIRTPVKASDLAYSSLTGLLYASAPADAPKYANSLVVIDPRTGAVVRSVPVGNDPSRLAISDDARYLYVVYDRTAFKRFDVSVLQADRSFRVPPGLPFPVFDVRDTKVMPGHPDILATSLDNRAIAIFDKGIMRPRISSDTFGNILAFSSDKTLWASTTLITPNQVWKYEIDSNGINKIGSLPTFYFSPFDRAIQISNGAIYGSTGNVYDIGQDGFSGIFNTDIFTVSSLAIDPVGGRIYFMVPDPSRFDASILSFDLATFRKIGAVRARAFGGIGFVFDLTTDAMVLCGKAGLAFASRQNPVVTILPLSEIKPLPPYVKPAPIPINNTARIIPLRNNHIIYDQGRGLIYATIPGSADNIGNGVVTIDPILGSVGSSLWVGSEPGTMALSADGTWLYVGIDAASSIRRVFLPFQHAENSFRLRTDDRLLNPTGHTAAEGIIGLPSSPDSVVVGLCGLECFFNSGSDGVVVYDNGAARPVFVPADHAHGPRSIQLAEDGLTVYGNELNDLAFFTMKISQSGIQNVSSVFGVFASRQLKCQSGLCFSEGGAIIDANTGSLIGSFPFNSNIHFSHPTQVAPDVPHGVVYFVSSTFSPAELLVSSFDLNTRKLIGLFTIPGFSEAAKDLFIWNGNQLAFNTENKVVLLPTALLTPPH